MTRRVRIAILGAGTAGLTALKEAQRHTDDVLLINDGPYGTTCARVGCMPSSLTRLADRWPSLPAHPSMYVRATMASCSTTAATR